MWPGNDASTYAFAFNIAASGLPGIGELAGIERDPSLHQPPRQRDVALRIDAGGIGELCRRRARTGSCRLTRAGGARARSVARSASPCPGCRGRIARTRTRARHCRRRRRRRHCGRRSAPCSCAWRQFSSRTGPCGPGKRVQSPAAKIAGSDVRPWSSTIMPSCAARPAAFASRSSACGADPDHDEIGRERRRRIWSRPRAARPADRAAPTA